MNALSKTRLIETSTVAMIIFSQSFNGFVAISLVADLPMIARHFAAQGNGVLFAQMVMVAPAISIIIGSPLAGKLARIAGPRRLMICSLLIYVLSGCYGVLSPGPVALLISRVVLGLVSSFLTTVAVSEAGRFEAARRDRLLGLSAATGGITVIIGILVAGWLTSRYGWTAPFILYLWPLTLLPAIILAVPRHAPAADTLLKDGFFDPLRAALPVYFLALVLCLIVFAPSIEGPFILAARGAADPSVIGLVVSLSIIATIAASAIYGLLGRKVPADAMVQIVFGLLLLSALMITLSRHAAATEAGLVASGLGTGVMTPMLMSRLLQNLPAHQAATALGWFLSTLYGSQMVDPILFSLINRFLPLPIFGIIAIVCCIGIVTFMVRGLQMRAKSRPKLL